MSAKTPDYIVRSIWNNARGIGAGPIVTRSEWIKYATDLGGEFSYWGDNVLMTAKSIGGGLYRIKGEKA